MVMLFSSLLLTLTIFREEVVSCRSILLVVDDLLNGLNLLGLLVPVIVQPKDMRIKAKITDPRIFNLSNNEWFLGCRQIKSSTSKDLKYHYIFNNI